MSGAAEVKTGRDAFRLRIASSLVLAPLMLAAVVYGGFPFVAIVMAAGMLALYEFAALVRDDRHKLLFLATATFYIALCFAAFLLVRFGFPQGAWLTLCLLLAVWASDTGAYFAGRTFGGPKMAPRLSPNKTWAGLAGAMGGCAGMLAALDVAAPVIAPGLSTGSPLAAAEFWYVLGGGLLLGAVGQAGDLLKSFFKRRAGVKDSGRLIPGHGGILDRIDSLMLASPVFFVMVALCL